ncbi:hypothetical protein ACFO1B_39950 [Dactylosporangium siamense]|uniref:Uncharacterized protein n=1 Tax=Dactylosporangium siamense TaxID=685454 RepID=A0A919PUJ0_9ACTN|nr:hypothetical protein [Dactylosporangium siamense]GIG49967.1 hypothetical protein Dsi01nite_080080 [Dactylosporangium siamense]
MEPIEGLRAELDRLQPADFDDMHENADGVERLAAVCDELPGSADAQLWMPLLFALFERLNDVDLGSPGPAVHTLEATGSGYLPLLADSVRRKPTPLTVWMVNRVLNQHPSDRAAWMELLESVQGAPTASDEAVNDARRFLAYQRGQQPGH